MLWYSQAQWSRAVVDAGVVFYCNALKRGDHRVKVKRQCRPALLSDGVPSERSGDAFCVSMCVYCLLVSICEYSPIEGQARPAGHDQKMATAMAESATAEQKGQKQKAKDTPPYFI